MIWKSHCEPEIFLKDLPKEYYRLLFLVDTGNDSKREMEISLKADELVGKLWLDTTIQEPRQSRNAEKSEYAVLGLYSVSAEDSGIFGSHKMFGNYLKRFQTRDVRKALIELFQVFDTKSEYRDPSGWRFIGISIRQRRTVCGRKHRNSPIYRRNSPHATRYK